MSFHIYIDKNPLAYWSRLKGMQRGLLKARLGLVTVSAFFIFSKNNRPGPMTGSFADDQIII